MSRVQLSLQDIADIRARCEAACPDDTDLLADMLEGETDLNQLAAWAFRKIEAERGTQAALKEQIDNRTARKTRAKKREDSMKSFVFELLMLSGLPKIELDEVTFGKTTRKGAPKVTDIDALPDTLVVVERKAKPAAEIKAHIAANDGVLPPGMSMSNRSVSLVVRTK